MNNVQQEQLFTDLMPAQAEATAGGRPPIDRDPSVLDVSASYGAANFVFRRTGTGSFKGNLKVKDTFRDGYTAYAKFDGKGSDGRILYGFTEFADHQGASGNGTSFIGQPLSFGRNVNIKEIRIAIYRANPGRDLVTRSSWLPV